ncbi:MAG: D-alanyl-D-alanine carboxypeptidase [Lachnospiraceae bacterium]|nr:D-alanyl-D-alanine carboxypeptidase [Lachnospiraceae bacterium]
MAASVPDERVLADTFASDLCVVTGEEESSDPSVNAESAGLFSIADQQVIFQKQVFERMHPASITKVMTALLAVKYGNPDDLVTVGEETVIREAGASLCNIHPGDTLTLEQLLYGLMLPSGNDAGTAIAVHMAGSIEAFSERMNEEARKIGATDTHFVNPHGLTDETHLTTAYDLYLILNEALKYPEFRKIIGTADYVAQYQDGQGNEISQTWHNSNKYLNGERETPEGLQVLGGKTGTTNAAGYCLILACEDEKGQDYVSVVLKAGSRSDLYDNMTNIIRKIVN